ncbi:MAG: Hsp33 family molecular chaperone HslO [Xanthomonadaceae bacterium]|nr:Hsp33 family molecular chaperone HslO [Xanthomonadaceae bacterium]
MSPASDVLHRFLIERAGVRGVLVQLSGVWREVAGRADYPPPLRRLLGEALAASALLTGNIKLRGSLSLELKSQGALRLLFAECSDQGRLRGLARWEGALAEPLDLGALPQALLAITIGGTEPGQQRYQGLVAVEAAPFAQLLEGYFERSEQMPTRIVLAADGERAAALMLQRLPREGGRAAEVDDDAWARVGHLTATLGEEELLRLPVETLLRRLYHEEGVRLFQARPLTFGCGCSRERVEHVLRALGRDEVEAALAARDGEIEVTCEFCASRYLFDRVDAERLLSATPAAPASPLSH